MDYGKDEPKMIGYKEVHETVQTNKVMAIECLSALVQTPSTTGQEMAVSQVLCDWLRRAGLQPKVIGCAPEHPNVLAEWFGDKPGKRFIFNGHMDTFAPADGDQMPEPYSGLVKDGVLYGRGAADMKGGDAAALMAVTFLRSMGFNPRGSVLLSYMCDEENGGQLGVKWLVQQELLNGDFGICMEPTDRKVCIGHSGIYRLSITYQAKPVFSGNAHPTKNALEKAIIAIRELYLYRDQVVRKKSDPDYKSPTLEVTTLHAGNATNVHAGKATFSIDYRLVPGETHESVSHAILRILEALKAADSDMDFSYNLISDRPVLEVPEDSDIVRACKTAYEQVTGSQAICYKRHGGSDAASIYAHNGIPMPNWGFAKIGYAGSINEQFSVAEYLQSIECYMLTLIQMLS